jgi:peptide/nickel transport system substrate-binding protein
VIDKRELPFQANNAFFYYADVDRATDFYREVMGFQLVADYGFARMFQIATSSFLTLVDATKGMHTADEPKTVTLALVTDDVAGWYEYAQAQGIPIHRDYTPDALKGHEGFVMLDPEGYFLEVERFNPHPENERLLPRIESLVPHYPEDQRATRRPMGLGITATVLWLYYRDLEAGLRFFAENLCLTRVADQAFSHIFASSRSGFLGAVQAGRGLHPYTQGAERPPPPRRSAGARPLQGLRRLRPGGLFLRVQHLPGCAGKPGIDPRAAHDSITAPEKRFNPLKEECMYPRIHTRAGRIGLILALVTLVAGLVIAACAPVPPGGSGAPDASASGASSAEASSGEPSRELTILFPVDFQSFEPNTVTSGPNTNIMHNVLETLVERDRTTPLLAESWTTLDDGLTWQFTLRQGVSFTNGEPFNADVAKYSIERILREDNANSSALSLFSDVIASVDVVDEYTVNVVTTRPYPDLIDLMRDAYMLPPGVADTPDFAANGIGTGPYMLESWTPGEAIVLTRNPDYWGDAPYFDTVTYRTVPDATVRTTELRSGGADVTIQVPIEELGRLNEPGLEVVRILSTQSMRIHLNSGVPPFDDVRVRQAMNYAIDRATILETLLEGAGQLMNGALGPDIPGYDGSIEVYPYDPDRARELLAEAGYADGVDVVLQITDGRYVRDRAIGEAIVAQLAEVGIRVDARYSEFSQWLQVFNTEGNGFMVVSQEDTLPTLLAPNFASSSQSFKRYGYANAEVDALIETISSSLDEAERMAALAELQRVLHEDAPWVYMWNPEDIYATQDSIAGFAPDGVGYFYAKDLSRE